MKLTAVRTEGAAAVSADLLAVPRRILDRFADLAEKAAERADTDLTTAVTGGAIGAVRKGLGRTVGHGVETEGRKVLAWAGFPSGLKDVITYHDQGFAGSIPQRGHRRMGYKAFGRTYSPHSHWVMPHDRTVAYPGRAFLRPAADRAAAWLHEQLGEITDQ